MMMRWLRTQKDDWNALTGGGLKGIPVFFVQLLFAALGIVFMAAILIIGGLIGGLWRFF